MNMDIKDTFHSHLQQIESYTGEELDQLPFGAIKLDHDGLILKYNQYESRLSGRSPEEVIGKNFFTEIAPCTNIQEFAGRFKDGVSKGQLNATFKYRFTFPKNPVDVEITMFSGSHDNTGWILVKQWRPVGRS
jgi:photoactive yellow protein